MPASTGEKNIDIVLLIQNCSVSHIEGLGGWIQPTSHMFDISALYYFKHLFTLIIVLPTVLSFKLVLNPSIKGRVSFKHGIPKKVDPFSRRIQS